MSAQDANKKGRKVTVGFGRKSPPQQWAALIRKRLRNKLRKGDTELLTALYERMERYAKGVEADEFRIDHKDRRRDLDRLVGRLITENNEPDRKIYRPTLIAWPLIGNERALQTLMLIDRVLGYFAREFERERDRQITLGEISEKLEAPLDDVADAMGYIVEGPASGARSTGWPEGPEWYFVPGENALDYPNLKSVVAQHAQWLRTNGRYPGPALPWWQRIRQHKVVVTLIIITGGIASALIFAGNIVSALSAIREFLTGGE